MMAEDIFDENVPEKLIGQRDWCKIKNELQKEGYREGLLQAQETTLQQGFNLGYKVAAGQAFGISKIRGEISAILLFSQDDQSTKHFMLKKLLEEVRTYEESLLKPLEEDIDKYVQITSLNDNKSKCQLTQNRSNDNVKEEVFTEQLDSIDMQLREEILDGFGLKTSDTACDKHEISAVASGLVGDMSCGASDKLAKNDSTDGCSPHLILEEYYRSDYHIKFKYLKDQFNIVYSQQTEGH